MHKRSVIIGALLTGLWAGIATCATLEDDGLLTYVWMEDYESGDSREMGFSTGFVIGVYNSILADRRVRDTACIPESATLLHLTQAARDYVHYNPKSLRKPAFSTVVSALQAAFPCNGKGKK